MQMLVREQGEVGDDWLGVERQRLQVMHVKTPERIRIHSSLRWRAQLPFIETSLHHTNKRDQQLTWPLRPGLTNLGGRRGLVVVVLVLLVLLLLSAVIWLLVGLRLWLLVVSWLSWLLSDVV